MDVHLTHEQAWARVGDTMVSGSAFLDGTCHRPHALARRISQTSTPDEFAEVLKETNGFFAVIHRLDDRVLAAVDHVRSWPLYYTEEGYISDSAEWLHENVTAGDIDATALDEYLFTCYTTGASTLDPAINQLSSGEVLMVQPGPVPATTGRYAPYEPTTRPTGGSDDAFDRVLLESFERLRSYAAGRPILVGLSTGYDSRAMALLLHRLGFDDVVTYTTAVASSGSEEIERARSIAESLGFEHLEIQTSHDDYHHLADNGLLEMATDIGYLAEYPHVNKLVLRRHLETAGIDPTEVVHILGHELINADDFLPPELRDQSTVSRAEMAEMLWKLHGNNWIPVERNGHQRRLREAFIGRLAGSPYSDRTAIPTGSAVAAFDRFYWEERLPKYIIARQEYEYLGFDIWYPLLDREVCQFFEGVGYQDRIQRRILTRYVERHQEGVIDESTSAQTSTASVGSHLWATSVGLLDRLPAPVQETVRRQYFNRFNRTTYDDDPRFGSVTREEFDAFSAPVITYRTLLLLYLYHNGYIQCPVTTEFDRAIEPGLTPTPTTQGASSTASESSAD